MSPVVIIIIVLLVGAIVFFTHDSKQPKKTDTKYLHQIARLFEGKVEKLEDFDNCHKVSFSYKGWDFYFLAISDTDFERVMTKGYLKAETPSKLKLSFTERPRSDVKANIQTIQDITNPWGSDAKLQLPRALSEFAIHTNNAGMTKKILEDDRAVKIIASFKNRDSRGHPVMSLDFNEGILSLDFHPSGMLKPNLWDLQHDVSSMQGYLDKMLVLLQIIREARELA